MSQISKFAFAALLPFAAWSQETLVLRDGTQLRGRMTGATENSITFRDRDGGTRRFDVDQIDTIRFDARNSNNYGGGNQQGNDGNRPRDFNNNGGDNRGNGNSGYRNGYSLTVPSGSEIAVRTNEMIDVRDAGNNRSFSAQVNRDVVDANGNVVIPNGSDARLVVRRMGDNTLALDLQTVAVNGQQYQVNTDDLIEKGNNRDGVGTNKRTGEYVGGGAVLGTLLGAIAGGGKGAAIGALAGGAAGAGTQVLTRGSQVRVPVESVLTFRLDSPLTLNQMR